MSKRCRYCFTKLEADNNVCNICKIDSTKEKKALTKEEKKTYYFCRTLFIIGFLNILGGVFGILASLSILFAPLTKDSIILFVPLIMGIFFLYFGISLRAYKQWCYIGGIVLYSVAIIINVLSRNFVYVLLNILFLYYIASPMGKQILYRKI